MSQFIKTFKGRAQESPKWHALPTLCLGPLPAQLPQYWGT
jgi:hypothetical protein